MSPFALVIVRRTWVFAFSLILLFVAAVNDDRSHALVAACTGEKRNRIKKRLALMVCMILAFAAQAVSQDVNISDYATCDGFTNDTTGIQTAFNLFTSGRSATGSGSIVFPTGLCSITAPIVYVGAAGTPIRISGTLNGIVGLGSGMIWNGRAGGTMLEIMGGNGYKVENLIFDQNSLARIGIHIAADNAWNTTLGTAVSSPGTVAVTPGSMANIAVGTLLSIDTGAEFELVYVSAKTTSTFTATFTKTHLASAQVGGTAASSDGVLRNVTATGVPDSTTDWETDPATASAGLVIGNVTAGGTPQVSEVRIYDAVIYGNGTCSGGIVFPEAGNAKNYWLYTPLVNNCQYGIDAFGGPNVLNVQGGDIASSTVADFRLAAAQTEISGVEVESATGHRFVMNGSVGANPANLTLIGNSFQSSAPSDDYVVQWCGSMTMIENQFWNGRTGSSVAKVQVGGPLFHSNDPATITSEGNWYQNAPAGYAPFYDGSGNALLPSYYDNQPVTVTSLGDLGGTPGAMIKLNNYLTASAITDQTGTTVSSTGLIRSSDTGCPVGWRNQANNADITICKNSADMVQVGGPAAAASMGGVESEMCPPNNWLNGISTSGVPSCTQPGAASLSDASSLATLAGAQVLSNKNLVSSTNTTSLLNFQGPRSPIRGNGANQTVYTWSLPTGTITPGSGISLRIDVAHSTGTASVSYLVTLNGVSIGSFSSNNSQFMYDGELMRTGATTGTLVGLYTGNSGYLSPLVNGMVSGLNWASNQILQVVFKAARTDYVTGLSFRLNIIH